MYELDKMILDYSHKEWPRPEFESELKNIYDINILNDMNFINENKVNDITECNVLHDIINFPKQTKNMNS